MNLKEVFASDPPSADLLSKYLASIGSKGGKAGKGKAKRRSKSHYRKAALKRWHPDKA